MNSKMLYTLTILIIIMSNFSVQVLSVVETDDSCVSKKRAFPLKIIAIASIVIASMIVVGSPLLTRSVPAFSPDQNLFTIIKAFASGIILATGFMHVLPDSFEMLSSTCLKEHPWHKFPFTGFVATFSAILALVVSSMTTSMYTSKKKVEKVISGGGGDQEMAASTVEAGSQLPRYRVIAMVLELGIIVHSVVIGLSLGASNNTCSIKGLIAALCFHQMFEGMGLGGCILQADYTFIKKATMAFFFSVTTPSGIVLGLAVSSTYKENNPRSLIIEGLLNASSAGLLIYMALVDLLAFDFMGSKLQKNYNF